MVGSTAKKLRFLFSQDVDDGYVHLSFSQGSVPLNMQITLENAKKMHECVGRCIQRLEQAKVESTNG